MAAAEQPRESLLEPGIDPIERVLEAAPVSRSILRIASSSVVSASVRSLNWRSRYSLRSDCSLNSSIAARLTWPSRSIFSPASVSLVSQPATVASSGSAAVVCARSARVATNCSSSVSRRTLSSWTENRLRRAAPAPRRPALRPPPAPHPARATAHRGLPWHAARHRAPARRSHGARVAPLTRCGAQPPTVRPRPAAPRDPCAASRAVRSARRAGPGPRAGTRDRCAATRRVSPRRSPSRDPGLPGHARRAIASAVRRAHLPASRDRASSSAIAVAASAKRRAPCARLTRLRQLVVELGELRAERGDPVVALLGT